MYIFNTGHARSNGTRMNIYVFMKAGLTVWLTRLALTSAVTDCTVP